MQCVYPGELESNPFHHLGFLKDASQYVSELSLKNSSTRQKTKYH